MSRLVLIPCLKIKEIVSDVPVDGLQVMLNGVPAVTVERVVKEKGFWALTSAVAVARRRAVENCILLIITSIVLYI